jgi:hypothetical protein
MEKQMGLDMKTRKKICTAIFKRYQKAQKNDKGKILDEYAATLWLNRDYLAHLIANCGKTRYALSDGKSVKFIAKQPVKGRSKTLGGAKTGRPKKYHNTFVAALKTIWELFDYQCGKLLSPMIRLMIEFLVIEFNMSEELRALFMAVSASTIDRKLRSEK